MDNIKNDGRIIDATNKAGIPNLKSDELTLKGHIYSRDQNPLPDILVRAFDRDLRSEQMLGSASTDADGYYEIQYSPRQFARSEKQHADLIVRAFHGKELIGESETFFNAVSGKVIDLTVADERFRGACEYQLLINDITPLLKSAAVPIPIGELTQDENHQDIPFLAGETGWPAEKLEHLVMAHRLSDISRIAPEFFYALLRGNTLLKMDSAIRIRFVVNLQTELKPLFYDVVLLAPVAIQKAIAQATRNNIIPETSETELNHILNLLAESKDTAQAYFQDEHPRKVFNLIEKKIVSGGINDIVKFLGRDFKGDISQMVNRLSEASLLLNPDDEAEVETDLRLADLFGYDEKIISHVRKLEGIEKPEDVPKLAALDKEGWKKLLNMHADRIIIGGAALNKKLIDLHAAALVNKLEKRFPTASFAAQLERDDHHGVARKKTILKMFRARPDFDLQRTNIDMFFRHNDVADWVENNAEEVKTSLKAMQRVFKVAPTYRQTRLLLKNGVNSAYAIHAMGEKQFVKRFTGNESFTPEEARKAYKKATDIHMASAILAADFKANVSGKEVHALSGALTDETLAAVTADFPNLKTLFEGTDACACEHCRSVCSPAAYVADVLEFLKHRKVVDTTAADPENSQSAKAVLFQRRPDIGDLDLSCENTDTPMPYIDMVCELLEAAVAPESGIAYDGTVEPGRIPDAMLSLLQSEHLPVTDQAVIHDPDMAGNHILRDIKLVCKIIPDDGHPGRWNIYRLRQTHLSAEALGAMPEYVNDTAYQTLREANVAFQLPFDLYHREATQYFEQFGVDRGELMAALQKDNTPTDVEIASEILNVSQPEALLITTEAADASSQHIYWNTGEAAIIEEVAVVDTFLAKTGLTYEQLQDLLDQDFINPSQEMFIRHMDHTCDAQGKIIANLDIEALDRIHRFLRIQGKTGLDFFTLDRILASPLCNGHLDADFLIILSDLIKLEQKLGLSVEEISIFYSRIPVKGKNGLYETLFLNKAANGFVEEALLPENVQINAAAAPEDQLALSDFDNTLSICLNIDPTDTELLINYLYDPVEDRPAILSFKNLTRLYASKVLSQKLGLGITDLLSLQSMTGISIFERPSNTLAFIEKAEKLDAASIAIADLQYLLEHKAIDLGSRTLKESRMTEFLQHLQNACQTVFEETKSPFDASLTADENKGPIKALLAKLPDFTEDMIILFMTIVDNTWQHPDTTPAEFIDATLGSLFDCTEIKARQADLSSPGGDVETEKNSLTEAVLKGLSTFYFGKAKQTILEQSLADTFGTEVELAAVLLKNATLKASLHGPADRTLLELLSTDDLIDTVNAQPVLPDISPANFAQQYEGLQLCHKMVQFIDGLMIKTEQAEWMLSHNTAMGWMALDGITYMEGITPVEFNQWEVLLDAVNLINAYPPVSHPDEANAALSINSIMTELLPPGAALDTLLNHISELTGWDRQVLQDLDAYWGFSTPDLSAYKLPATFHCLERAVVLLRKLGVSVATGCELIKPSLAMPDVQALRQALKARYEDSQWFGVLKSIQDKLRAQKRDALVACLLAANPDFQSSSDLYDYFLIDVEMGSCQPTSRIVQAHGTLQLFVQRCMMGLEPTAVADVSEDPQWSQWQWMKNYRVWEANRKVFLYPENWIEPELRDDKSFLFSEMEADLLKNELNERAVENAAIHYLEKLDKIALLEVMAVYYQTSNYSMHVFARTKGGDPAEYYYRCMEKERYWTPWEKVELDISGEHLLAFERNSRLYLAWPIFTEAPRDDQEIKIPEPDEFGYYNDSDIQKTHKRWKIQLAISEYSGGRWLPKKVSKDPIFTNDYYEILPAKEDFQFAVLDLKQAGFYISCTHPDNGKKPGMPWPSDNKKTCYPGAFSLTGCKGYPEPMNGLHFLEYYRFFPRFKDTELKNLKFQELDQIPGNDLAIQTFFYISDFLSIIEKTPGIFKVNYPHQMSRIDIILFLLQLFLGRLKSRIVIEGSRFGFPVPMGTFMPFFYEDSGGIGGRDRSFVIVPGFYEKNIASNGNQDNAKTVSNMLEILDRAMRLLKTYWAKLESQDDVTTQNIWSKIKEDTEYQKIEEELQAYKNLRPGYQFRSFYHPRVCKLKAAIYKDGIPGLLNRDTQTRPTDFFFGEPGPAGAIGEDWTFTPSASENPGVYAPTSMVVHPCPVEDIDFNNDGSYAGYNWELFFHLPFTIALKLSKDQRFEEAMDWFHYIFNPMGALEGDTPARYWVTKPFFLHQSGEDSDYVRQRIDSLLYAIAADPSGATISDLKFAVEQWRENPFMPHVVARSRPVAYQKAVVMKYIDNLLAWADHLFRQDTMESVNQATQLYILAEKLLGPKPRTIPPAVTPPAFTYNQLESKIDLFGNALLELENYIPDLNLLPHAGEELPITHASTSPLTLAGLYFCIPQNDQLLERWDRVSDRLFKIRHCQNIDGVERTLALFSPPIDPGALVRAAAAGLDMADVISSLNAPLPFYRFSVMARKATELAQLVNGLGNALLQVMEKKDAEQLARLRSDLELQVLSELKMLKEKQVEEADEQINALKQSQWVIEERLQYFANIEKIIPNEQLHLDNLDKSQSYQESAQFIQLAASLIALIPDIDLGASGFGGTPITKFKFGGLNLAQAAKAASDVLSFKSMRRANDATMASIKGGHDRRWQEWKYQERLARKELDQIEKQIEAADIRKEIAQKDLQNHCLQIENAEKTDAFMRNKFTNAELYDWMVGRISDVYFQAYQLAFDVAKKAERCFQYEFGCHTQFIKSGYWDSMKTGLMAADALLYDIKRMEVSYLTDNKREYEITKHISLAMLDPMNLIRLKNNGRCVITIPEAIFDMDHPGHYKRRIKNVSISIPCVAGPFSSVNCKLSLVSSKYRNKPLPALPYAEDVGNDQRFVYNIGSIQSIATSQSLNDSGMFELNFHDNRYLPFEGAGAVSTWLLELPEDFKQFDYSTISDVILHMKYTAREGGSSLKTAVSDEIRTAVNTMLTSLEHSDMPLMNCFSLKQDFSTELHQLMHSPASTSSQTTTLKIDAAKFPFFLRDKTINIEKVKLFVIPAQESATDFPEISFIKGGTPEEDGNGFTDDPDICHLPAAIFTGAGVDGSLSENDQWTLAVTSGRFEPQAVQDIGLIFYYNVS